MKVLAQYDMWRSKAAAALLVIAGILLLLNLIFPPPVQAARQVSPVVTDTDGRMLSAFTVEDGTWRLPAKLNDIDPRFTQRLVAIEDKRFYAHSGVDVPAIVRALRSWNRAGEAVSGASTITMQLVRQLEPRPRTLRSKAIESIRAVQIELWMSKAEILEAYLTHVPYGGNIEGVEAASRLYFGKSAQYLTDGEIALLISLPQAPEARRPDRRKNAARRGRDVILGKIYAQGHMSKLAYLEAIESPVNIERVAMDDTAWITANGIATRSETSTTQSTLDGNLQAQLEALVTRFASDLPGSVNVAAVVVENETLKVRAHIASADRRRPGGWIDMTERARSPGSTLKPFIYGMAMDDGTITAGSFAHDAPTRFGSYRPENFNRRYHGQVRIHEALRHSLNVPAVAVLDQIGGARFETSLQGAGVNLARLGKGAEDAGLALALGGAGMTVNDVAVLYAGLANGGQVRRLKWTDDAPDAPPYRLMQGSSAADITRILAQAPTPDGRIPSWLKEGGHQLAYKTGTSYGFRDAWAAGYSDEWTVVVWTGRPDGAPRFGATGRTAAAPLLFDIFETLPSRGGGDVYQKDDAAPLGLAVLDRSEEGAPHILFPPDGAEIFASNLGEAARGFTLSVRSDASFAAYINGMPVPKEGRHHVWRPASTGFYEVSIVDGQGRSAKSRVRVLSSRDLSAMTPL